MSVNSTAAAASAALPSINLHPHGHKKGGHGITAGNSVSASTASTSGSNASPTSTQGLFGKLFDTLEQVIGIPAITSLGISSTASGAGAPATAAVNSAAAGTAPAANQTQKVQTFLHSLMQALKADGLGGTPSAPAATGAQSTAAASATTAASAAAGSSAATPTGSAGQYEGSLVSSLQTLIQQVGSSGATNATTANLTAAFNNLTQGTNAAATSGAAATNGTTSTASLQSFLSNLLQTVQSNGGHSLSALGNNVNANV
jgi:hypothetical protein